MNSDSCVMIVQPFTKELVECQIHNGNNLVDVFVLKSGQEKLIKLKDGEVITLSKVMRRVPKDHVEVH